MQIYQGLREYRFRSGAAEAEGEGAALALGGGIRQVRSLWARRQVALASQSRSGQWRRQRLPSGALAGLGQLVVDVCQRLI